MSFRMITIGLCLLLSSFGLAAQIAAPQSVVVKMEMPKGAAADQIQFVSAQAGLPPTPSGDQEITVLIELAEDQTLQELRVQIDNPSNQEVLLDQSIDLITRQGLAAEYQLERDGKIIQVHLGLFPLPATFRCQVWLVDVDGQSSPASTYQGHKQ
ncbi:MAG: hypothetical protein AAFP19_20125 [Bacteroidota bacterium]